MSVNFHNGSAFMVGADIHNDKIMVPQPFAVAFATFQIWPTLTPKKRLPKVTSDGWHMIQDGCDFYLIPHIPVAYANPFAWAAVPEIVRDSGSKPLMSVHSVTSYGESLATAMIEGVGLNVNCWEYGLSLPSGLLVPQLNTVKTTPTQGDLAGALAGLAVDNAIGALVDAAGRKGLLGGDASQAAIKHLIRRLPEIFKALGLDTVAEWADPAGKVKKAVQSAVDG
jgi:hypothetical protein